MNHPDHMDGAPGAVVTVDDYWQRRYWCRLFECTERRLRVAVKEVGASPEAVRERLARARRTNLATTAGTA